MEFSIKSIVLYLSVLLTGLSAGFFYAWAVTVIPGTLRTSDAAYLETMQHINRAILNPAFFVIFFGCIIALTVSGFQHFRTTADLRFWLIAAAAVVYLAGTFGVTAFGNVPMNEALDLLELADMGQEQLAETRKAYEGPWNRLHMVRTAFSVLSFGLVLLAAIDF